MLKNNISLILNLIKSLDFVVTAATAVSSMSYSIGTPTLVFQPSRNWTNLGTDYYPWSKYMKQFIPFENNTIETTLNEITKYITDNSSN